MDYPLLRLVVELIACPLCAAVSEVVTHVHAPIQRFREQSQHHSGRAGRNRCRYVLPAGEGGTPHATLQQHGEREQMGPQRPEYSIEASTPKRKGIQDELECAARRGEKASNRPPEFARSNKMASVDK
eukprot:scaffold17011_cov135-Isochrysis_galbana.AAC.2